ncbi:MAG TPA: cysteine hydrolase family protein [Thermomicrobiales bacterium]|nr:cysteine hydrolase family protein [Thermomicrobiales bacterium]
MSLSLRDNTPLVVIDVQQGFADPGWGPRNNPGAESRIGQLVAAWREAGRPIFHIQHLSTEPNSPLRPGQPGVEFQDVARPLPDEPVLTKHVNSAFIGTDLEERLRWNGADAVVIVGLTTNHCVETTTRMAGNLGFNPVLVSDATATFDRVGPDGRLWPAEQVHAMTLANLHDEFARIATTGDVIAAFERE